MIVSHENDQVKKVKLSRYNLIFSLPALRFPDVAIGVPLLKCNSLPYLNVVAKDWTGMPLKSRGTWVGMSSGTLLVFFLFSFFFFDV